jgi:2-polyprenyl-3-methyl-5-hydroxy-6-metoxy-1,4-benzoquinol methylase
MPKDQPSLKLLDFGAGNAHISRTFKNVLKDDAVIYCLEPNPMCKHLYKKYDLIQITDIKEVPVKINLIYMIEVIEHLENPISILKDLIELLQANGKIFISTPVGELDENLTNAYDTPSHLHFFTEKSLNLALKKAGLREIIYQHYPEMYPLPKFSAILAATKFVKCFLNVFKSNKYQEVANDPKKPKIGHLVGLTEIKSV